MATFSEWSATPSENTDVGGVNIAEGCPPLNLNNAIREVMAAAKTQDTNKADGALYATKANTVVSTNAKATGRGGVWHFLNSGLADGGIAVVAEGSARPEGAAIVFYFAA